MEVLASARFDSPLGTLQVVSSDRGLCYVELPHASGRGLHGWIQRHAGGAQTQEAPEPNRAAMDQLLRYLAGEVRVFDLPLDLRGTPFQREVYERVGKIPYGESRSYGQIAEELGRPRAVRAVGAANGANPLPLVIPCHRVIGSNGQLQGYAGGIDMKAKLLAMEQSTPREDRLL